MSLGHLVFRLSFERKLGTGSGDYSRAVSSTSKRDRTHRPRPWEALLEAELSRRGGSTFRCDC